MLVQIAAECRRWTAGACVELALVIPVVAGIAGPPVAIALGSDAGVEMDTARVMRIALAFGATEIVVAHNHVEVQPPSLDDHAVTRRLVAAAAILGIALRAHVVVDPSGWYDCLQVPSERVTWLCDDAA